MNKKPTQKQMMYATANPDAKAYHVLEDIMESGTPLTEQQLIAMGKRRPEWLGITNAAIQKYYR